MKTEKVNGQICKDLGNGEFQPLDILKIGGESLVCEQVVGGLYRLENGGKDKLSLVNAELETMFGNSLILAPNGSEHKISAVRIIEEGELIWID